MNHRTRLKRRNARFAGAFYRDDASKWDAKAAARWCAKMNRADRRQLAWLHRIGASPMSIVSHRLQHLNRTINATNRAFGKLLSAAERLRDELG